MGKLDEPKIKKAPDKGIVSNPQHATVEVQEITNSVKTLAEGQTAEVFIVRSMDEIITDLFANPEIDGSKTEYLIDGDVNSQQLKILLDLPYEIAITEKKGRLILSPITWIKYGNSNRAFENRLFNSKLFLHTHNKNPKEKIIVNTPSFQDICLAMGCKETTTRIVIHGNGITKFGPILHDPITGESDQGANIVYRYEKRQGFTLGDNYATEKQPFLQDIYGFEEETRMAREFAESTGMILDEAAWDDVEGLNRLLTVINLQS